jgi:flagellar hook-basal body complex protein FliE
MSKRKLLVKIAGSWFRVTSLDGIQVDTGEQFSNLFLNELQEANIICTNGEEPKQAPQQKQDVDYNEIRIEMAKAYIQSYGEQTHDHTSKSFAEKAFNFANEFVKKLIENQINP